VKDKTVKIALWGNFSFKKGGRKEGSATEGLVSLQIERRAKVTSEKKGRDLKPARKPVALWGREQKS